MNPNPTECPNNRFARNIIQLLSYTHESSQYASILQALENEILSGIEYEGIHLAFEKEIQQSHCNYLGLSQEDFLDCLKICIKDQKPGQLTALMNSFQHNRDWIERQLLSETKDAFQKTLMQFLDERQNQLAIFSIEDIRYIPVGIIGYTISETLMTALGLCDDTTRTYIWLDEQLTSLNESLRQKQALDNFIEGWLINPPHIVDQSIVKLPENLQQMFFETRYPNTWENTQQFYNQCLNDVQSNIPIVLLDTFSKLDLEEQAKLLQFKPTAYSLLNTEASFNEQATLLAQQAQSNCLNPLLVTHFLYHGQQAISSQYTKLKKIHLSLTEKDKTFLQHQINIQSASIVTCGAGFLLGLGSLISLFNPAQSMMLGFSMLSIWCSQLILLIPFYHKAYPITNLGQLFLFDAILVASVLILGYAQLVPWTIILVLVSAAAPLLANGLKTTQIKQHKTTLEHIKPDLVTLLENHSLQSLFSIDSQQKLVLNTTTISQPKIDV